MSKQLSAQVKKYLFLFSLVLSLVPSSVMANFIQSAIGNAVVGDASAVYYNPAALTLIPNPQLVLGNRKVWVNAYFDGTTRQNATGLIQNGRANSNVNFYLPDGYYAMPINDKINVGIGVLYTNFGEIDYPRDSILRYFQVFSFASSLDLIPSIGFKVNQYVALGAGLDFEYLRITLSSISGAPAFGLPDTLSRNSGSGWGKGMHAGILITPKGLKKKYDTLQGKSIFKNTKFCTQHIDSILNQNNLTKDAAFTIIGLTFSRGGAKFMFDINKENEGIAAQFPNADINIVAIDPVPGPGNHKAEVIQVPSAVKFLRVIYSQGEANRLRARLFNPIEFKIVDKDQTKVSVILTEGRHSDTMYPDESNPKHLAEADAIWGDAIVFLGKHGVSVDINKLYKPLVIEKGKLRLTTLVPYEVLDSYQYLEVLSRTGTTLPTDKQRGSVSILGTLVIPRSPSALFFNNVEFFKNDIHQEAFRVVCPEFCSYLKGPFVYRALQENKRVDFNLAIKEEINGLAEHGCTQTLLLLKQYVEETNNILNIADREKLGEMLNIAYNNALKIEEQQVEDKRARMESLAFFRQCDRRTFVKTWGDNNKTPYTQGVVRLCQYYLTRTSYHLHHKEFMKRLVDLIANEKGKLMSEFVAKEKLVPDWKDQTIMESEVSVKINGTILEYLESNDATINKEGIGHSMLQFMQTQFRIYCETNIITPYQLKDTIEQNSRKKL